MRAAADRLPTLHRDLEDHPRDHDGDDRVREGEAERHENGAQQDAEADDPVGSRVIAVGNQCRAVQAAASAEAHLRRDLVAGEADNP